MPLAKDQHVIQALAAERSHEPRRVGVEPQDSSPVGYLDPDNVVSHLDRDRNHLAGST